MPIATATDTRPPDAAIIPPPMKWLYLPDEMLPPQKQVGKSRIIAPGEKVSVLVPIPIEGNYRIPVGIVPLDAGDLTVEVLVDDIALLSNEYTLEGTGEDGKPFTLTGKTSEVVRRQPDGRWLYIIDHPSGAED